MDVTDHTYNIVYNRQLPDSTLEILTILIADKEVPPTPEALLLPMDYTSLYQGHMVPPLTPVPHIPALSLMEPDPPPLTYLCRSHQTPLTLPLTHQGVLAYPVWQLLLTCMADICPYLSQVSPPLLNCPTGS